MIKGTGEKLLLEAEKCTPLPGVDLPVYRYDAGVYSLFYTPGYIVVVPSTEIIPFQRSVISEKAGHPGRYATLRQMLRRNARLAYMQYDRQHTKLYEPVCLTLYLSNQCNLACTYCFADASIEDTQILDLRFILRAAHNVADNCRRKGLPFTIGFHGGGEPTLQHSLLEEILNEINQITAEYALDQFRYIATNGVLRQATASWVANSFDLVGLSCDGPPKIQDSQRTTNSGRATSKVVENTAAILKATKTRFHVRATITPASMPKQAEIADYIGRELGPEEIHFEPLYAGGRSTGHNGFSLDDAPDYVGYFFEARSVAQKLGIPLKQSSPRLDAVHGAFCNVLKQNLTLIPGNLATACFKISRVEPGGNDQRLLEVGHDWANSLGRQVANLQRALHTTPRMCQECFNRYHCAGLCPDVCRLEANHSSTFRCLIQKQIAFEVIQRSAEKLWENGNGSLAGATLQV